jgi:hypothetical protein
MNTEIDLGWNKPQACNFLYTSHFFKTATGASLVTSWTSLLQSLLAKETESETRFF